MQTLTGFFCLLTLMTVVVRAQYSAPSQSQPAQFPASPGAAPNPGSTLEQPQAQTAAPAYEQPLTATNYRTDDGQQRFESVDGQGNVRGQYSYVDPSGKTITLKYTAGKDGFQVQGDHLPRAPALSPAPSPTHAQTPFDPQSSAPQYNSQLEPRTQFPFAAPPRLQQQDNQHPFQYNPQFQPQHNPQLQPQNHPQLQPQYIPETQAQYVPQPQLQHVPQPQPQYAPQPQPQYVPQPQPQYNPQSAPQYKHQPVSQYNPQSLPLYNFQPQSQNNAQFQYNAQAQAPTLHNLQIQPQTQLPSQSQIPNQFNVQPQTFPETPSSTQFQQDSQILSRSPGTQQRFDSPPHQSSPTPSAEYNFQYSI